VGLPRDEPGTGDGALRCGEEGGRRRNEGLRRSAISGEPTADLIVGELEAEREWRRSLEQRALSLVSGAGVIGSLAGIAARSFELPILTRIMLGLGIAFLAGGALLGLAVGYPNPAPAVATSGLRKRIGLDEWSQPMEKHLRSASRARLQIIDAFRGVNGRKARRLKLAMRLAAAGIAFLLAAVIVLVGWGGPPAPSEPEPAANMPPPAASRQGEPG
jgi:hypothetical protein